jgi:hypothetical protein
MVLATLFRISCSVVVNDERWAMLWESQLSAHVGSATRLPEASRRDFIESRRFMRVI